MRKAVVLFIVATALLLSGCTLKETSMSANAYNAETPSMMTIVEATGSYAVLVDNVTRVMYIAKNNSHGSITVMVNADGTPRIWKGEVGG